MAYKGHKVSRKRRARTCGFRTRQKNNQNVLKRRRAKGRKRLTPVIKPWK